VARVTVIGPRILHVYKDVHPEVPGGIERHVDDLRRHVPDAVSDVLVAGRGVCRTRERQGPNGREVAVWQFGRALSTPLTAGYPRRLRQLAPDLIHLHMPNPTAELSIFSLPRRKPLVVSYHADIVRQARLLPVYRLLIRRVLQRADVVISGTHRLVETSPFLREAAEKVQVIPYAVDVAAFDRSTVDPPERSAASGAQDPLTVLAAGRLVYYKGFAQLIALADRLEGRLVIVGGGPLEKELRAQAAGRENVVLTGKVSDRVLRAHLAAADVFVLPSINRAESFGIATIEAQAMGVPAVVTDVGTGTVEAVQDGVTGYVVPPSDADALVAAINTLLGDHELRATMGQAARRRAVERFDVHRSADAHRAIYRSLLGC